MFVDFFYILRDAGVPVTLREFLGFLECGYQVGDMEQTVSKRSRNPDRCPLGVAEGKPRPIIERDNTVTDPGSCRLQNFLDPLVGLE